MASRKKPRTKFVNVNTTDLHVANLSDALWFHALKIENETREANVSSLMRDRIARVTERLKHYAVTLGRSLEAPNDTVFSSAEGTRKHLNLLLDRAEGKRFV